RAAVRRRPVPARALRLLPASDAPRAAELLTALVRTHPDLAESLLPDLPAERGAIEAVLADDTRLPAASGLPPLLTAPPWTRPRRKAKPVVIEGLPSPGTSAIVWAQGERESWASRTSVLWRWPEGDLERAGSLGALPEHQQIATVVGGPEDDVRPYLPAWTPPPFGDVADWMRAVVARFGPDARDAALVAALRAPATASGLLLPLLSDEIARSMAEWLVRLKSTGRTARAWFARHGLTAVPALIPDALAAPGPARDAAEAPCGSSRTGAAPPRSSRPPASTATRPPPRSKRSWTPTPWRSCPRRSRPSGTGRTRACSRSSSCATGRTPCRTTPSGTS
ncbi:hypothetical protein, partial [Actinomadura sp. CNU-125]|uniref:hypothetical protein n=1 Tax=Actinomadura sp. CNU-125 TaxID=1904961 RepID=UPI0021CC846F